MIPNDRWTLDTYFPWVKNGLWLVACYPMKCYHDTCMMSQWWSGQVLLLRAKLGFKTLWKCLFLHVAVMCLQSGTLIHLQYTFLQVVLLIVQFAIAGYIFFDRHWREVHHHLWIPMSSKFLSSFLVGMQCDFPLINCSIHFLTTYSICTVHCHRCRACFGVLYSVTGGQNWCNESQSLNVFLTVR